MYNDWFGDTLESVYCMRTVSKSERLRVSGLVWDTLKTAYSNLTMLILSHPNECGGCFVCVLFQTCLKL